MQYGKTMRRFIKAAWLWVSSSENGFLQPEEIGFMTFVPQITKNAPQTLDYLTQS